jgi:hypothetical protein
MPLGAACKLSLVGSAPCRLSMLARGIAISTTIFLITIEAVGNDAAKVFWYFSACCTGRRWLALAAMGWRLLNQEEPDEKKKPPLPAVVAAQC